MHNFVLQCSFDSKEITRIKSLSDQIVADTWNYYTFYNNGNSNRLSVYVTTNTHAKLNVVISRGLQSRPPISNKPLEEKIGFGSVELLLRRDDITKIDGKGLMDHYTVGVMSSVTGQVSLYWNNKEDLNFVELTPNEPSSMQLVRDKKFYFTLFARELSKSEKKDSLLFYIQTSSKVDVYLLKTTTGDLLIPSESNSMWQTSVSSAGGISVIEISAQDPNYCLGCSYVGSIEHYTEGTVTLLAAFKHDQHAILLNPGVTFPDLLRKDGRSLYRLANPDSDLLDITVSLLSGFVDIYLSASPDVSESKFTEKHHMEQGMNSHKFIVINPSKYNITQAHDFYLLVINKVSETSSFNLHLDKNSVRTPIKPGITRIF